MTRNDNAEQASLATACKRLVRWAGSEALPLWLEQGVHESGGFVEALDFDGRPIASNVSRVRVQARQVFSFCVGRDLGLIDASADAVIVDGAEFLIRSCRRDDGLYGSTVDLAHGELIDDTPDLYDTAFVLLALARCVRRFESDAFAEAIAELLHGLDTLFARRTGDGYRERLPLIDDLRLQNPHMHLFESLLCLATVDEAARRRARRLFEFIEARFIDADTGVVWERIDADGEPVGRTFEPGHSMEWIWLIAERERVLGDEADELMSSLYERAVGVIGDAPRIALEATLQTMTREAGSRLWSQTEAIRAHLEMAHRLDRDLAKLAARRAADAIEGLFDNWLEPAVRGGWHDHFDATGRLLSAHMPASSLYHLMTAVEAAAAALSAANR